VKRKRVGERSFGRGFREAALFFVSREEAATQKRQKRDAGLAGVDGGRRGGHGKKTAWNLNCGKRLRDSRASAPSYRG